MGRFTDRFKSIFSGGGKKEPASKQDVSNATTDIRQIRESKDDMSGRAPVQVNAKFSDFLDRNKNDDGSYNSAAQAIINQYDDGRSNYQVAMNNARNKPGGAEAYRAEFPNPLINIARSVGDMYEKFSPTANIMKAINSAKNLPIINEVGRTFNNATGIFSNEDKINNMGTRMSDMDYDDASNPRGINMADVSGPGSKLGYNIDNTNNATTNNSLSLPEGYQVMNANSLDSGLQFLLDQGVIDPVDGSGNLNLGNLFGSAQDGVGVLNDYNLGDYLPNNGIFQGFNNLKEGFERLDDGKGFDFDIRNKEFKYNKDLFGGDVGISASPNNVGIMFNKSFGA
tara:strand:- start:288 stop:1307 length:1020 start_codon:yes stop_codon:yes gene_type:complete